MPRSATLGRMDSSNILNQIDKQIAQLQQAKALLTDSSAARKVGRPGKAVTVKVAAAGRKPLSAAAKARISAAQKKRWAKIKKAAPAPAKKTPAKKAVVPAKTVAVKIA